MNDFLRIGSTTDLNGVDGEIRTLLGGFGFR